MKYKYLFIFLTLLPYLSLAQNNKVVTIVPSASYMTGNLAAAIPNDGALVQISYDGWNNYSPNSCSVEIRVSVNDLDNQNIKPLDFDKMKSFCKDLSALRHDAFTTSEFISKLDDLLEISRSDSTYKKDFQKAWAAHKTKMKCKTNFVDWNTGEPIEIFVLSYALKEGNSKLIWELIKRFELDVNVWNPLVTDPTKNETPLDYVERKMQDSNQNVKQYYVEMRDGLIKKFHAKRCEELPGCMQ